MPELSEKNNIYVVYFYKNMIQDIKFFWESQCSVGLNVNPAKIINSLCRNAKLIWKFALSWFLYSVPTRAESCFLNRRPS